MSNIRSIHGSLNVRGLFECRACGVRTLGDSFSVEVEAARPQDLAQQLASTPTPAYSMPRFWASYGGTFECPACQQ